MESKVVTRHTHTQKRKIDTNHNKYEQNTKKIKISQMSPLLMNYVLPNLTCYGLILWERTPGVICLLYVFAFTSSFVSLTSECFKFCIILYVNIIQVSGLF